MQQTWTILQDDSPNHSRLWSNQDLIFVIEEIDRDKRKLCWQKEADAEVEKEEPAEEEIRPVDGRPMEQTDSRGNRGARQGGGGPGPRGGTVRCDLGPVWCTCLRTLPRAPHEQDADAARTTPQGAEPLSKDTLLPILDGGCPAPVKLPSTRKALPLPRVCSTGFAAESVPLPCDLHRAE